MATAMDTYGASPAAVDPSWQSFVADYAAWLQVRDAQLVPAATSGGLARLHRGSSTP